MGELIEAEETSVERISVIGTTGSGKTTLSARLAVVLGVTHIELELARPENQHLRVQHFQSP